jgi:hypothetical protein
MRFTRRANADERDLEPFDQDAEDAQQFVAVPPSFLIGSAIRTWSSSCATIAVPSWSGSKPLAFGIAFAPQGRPKSRVSAQSAGARRVWGHEPQHPGMSQASTPRGGDGCRPRQERRCAPPARARLQPLANASTISTTHARAQRRQPKQRVRGDLRRPVAPKHAYCSRRPRAGERQPAVTLSLKMVGGDGGSGRRVPQRFLLLVYGMPTKPTAGRVAVWRSLKKTGAVYL